ncbi:phosphatidylglycerophosphatase A [Candidatus Kryptobacter tengchongensis]|uniref:Phosphatidylglycerophosphatase A n=1 Tax=Kryptobacter tengchongensis TaxID=1643429 RepID=A0A916LIK5_KRYT1|nr:phosphatidylglycerophosphatase A [Candidatus Kryptobacter tengchongensis]CUS98079.1 phosphatidylglycerophosphatase A [Candidatus Kryptobacter tengchongensis]
MSQREKELRNQYKISLFSKLVATGFFSGYIPIAPGTAGSLVAVLIYWVFLKSNLQILIALLIFFVLGIFTSSRFEQRDGHDPKIVVVDEIVGMWLSLLFIEKKILNVFIAFLVFRAMDVIKPPPARGFDRMKGGFGIMMDDVVAGIYANILTQAILNLFLK